MTPGTGDWKKFVAGKYVLFHGNIFRRSEDTEPFLLEVKINYGFTFSRYNN